MAALVTLITDFGCRDEYVGVMKGVILSIAPDARIVDLSHHIPPQQIVQAAYMLKAAHGYFPDRTIHTVVVDPGVGSQRRILVLDAFNQLFVAPDNGVLTPVLDGPQVDTLIHVTASRYFLPRTSSTFHGRDIFAPIAGHLANGIAPALLGKPLVPGSAVRCRMPKPSPTADGGLRGCVIGMDRFGNLITNIDAETIDRHCRDAPPAELRIRIGGVEIPGVVRTYSSVPPGSLLAVMGSRGYLEISVNGGSAREFLKSAVNDTVRIDLPATHLTDR